jgi:hypothetical protein
VVHQWQQAGTAENGEARREYNASVILFNHEVVRKAPVIRSVGKAQLAGRGSSTGTYICLQRSQGAQRSCHPLLEHHPMVRNPATAISGMGPRL